MLSATGTGFLNLIARGMELPPSKVEANRPNSSPYDWPLRNRVKDNRYRAETERPAAMEGMEPVRKYPMMPPTEVRRERIPAEEEVSCWEGIIDVIGFLVFFFSNSLF